MAEFSVTEKRPVKAEAEITFKFNLEEVRFLAVAARYYNQRPGSGHLVTQLENALNQAKAIENG